MKPITLALLSLAFVLAGCQHARFADAYTSQVEAAHGADAWRRYPALSCDITVTLGSETMIEGAMLFETSLARSRLDLADGTIVVFDGRDAWVSPAESPLQAARFHALTWPYFAAVPMKLGDRGARLTELGARTLQGTTYHAAAMTFKPGTGDTPDDWYVLYVHPRSGLLRAMAYIITYGTDATGAEQDPHAITYHDHVTLGELPRGQVQFATRWQFWGWDPDEGIVGDAIGQAVLSNVRLTDPPVDTFTIPQDSRVDVLPEGGP